MAITALRENWCLLRDGSKWVIGEVSDSCFECSEAVTRLGSGRTVAAAIRAAVAEVERREQEDVARRADYQRRKAAGELTELEKLGEQSVSIWSRALLREMEKPSVLFSLVNRTYESELEQGDTIQINVPSYKAIR